MKEIQNWQPMLKVSHVHKTFNPHTPNEVRALQGVNLDLGPGKFLIVLGGNGSGKSTMLNAVAGSFFVDEGTISIDGNDVTRWREDERAKLIGRVFQNPFSGTAPNMSIAENVALAALRGQPRGFGSALNRSMREEIRARVRGLNMGLEDRLENMIGSLSGGQRQALTLLMATWVKPKLLLLDEHTAALDPKTADKVIHLTENVISQGKLTALMVTHSMQQAVNLGDRIIMMHKGNIVRDFQGAEKKRLRVEDLLEQFEDIRRMEQLDESASEMLQENYI
ncbi:MAG TPA: ATP-binding cassette domain-containing protein [Candidatus Methylacidiphilales bacterium]|nr:ATP-binding cassette domain-containing protein [Candidatus Methylacidiphilales bacterium]